ncbi:MAG: hypothetical protein FWG72_00605 [Oscillospiraceae bacterium]|nr:hypothetical protein [Oscillospiraceae bacterium]
MFKRILTLAAACLLLLPLLLPAAADVLIEPRNSFYERNAEQCVPLNRLFYINGEDGYLSVNDEPGSRRETARLLNGEQVFIMFTYDRSGKPWGVYEHGSDTGWLPMGGLYPVHDVFWFMDEYADELYPYTGDNEALLSADSIVVWPWPGAGTDGYTFPNENLQWLDVTTAYTDPDGREWGFIGYFYGRRNVWICLADPANDAIPAFHPAPEPQLYPQPDVWPLPDDPGRFPWLAVGLAAGAVIVTVTLLLVFWKPKPSAE